MSIDPAETTIFLTVVWADDGVSIQNINYFNLAYPARQAIIRMNEPGWLMTNTRRRMA
jgi:hypothetical protein